MPIKQGKTATYKAFIKECLGSKKNEYKDLLLRYSLNTLQMWLHTIDGKDYVLFTHDMSDDAAKKLEGWENSKHPFDQWFNKQLKDCYDVKDASDYSSQPIFVGSLDAREQDI